MNYTCPEALIPPILNPPFFDKGFVRKCEVIGYPALGIDVLVKAQAKNS